MKDGQISVQFAGDGQSSPVQQITQDMLLYGFADGAAEIGDQTISVPLRFVGTFKVVSADGTSVNFEPVFVADDAEVAGPTSSWSFFEKMPGDDRDVFKLDLGMTKDNLDLSQYRQALKDTYMPAVQLGMDPSSEEYEALLDEYTFDGVARNLIDTWIAQQTDRINDRFEPEDRRLAVELELRNKSQEFTVDGSGNLGRDGVFNNEGEAIDPQLHLGNPVQIDNGQRITVDKLSGETGYKRADGTTDQEPLVSSEQAEVVNEYYVRELRDYPYLLQELGIQTKKLVDTKAAVDQAIKDTNELVADAEQQQDTRNEITAKLEDDIDKMRNDLNVVTELLRKRTLEYQQKQEQIRTYYKQIMEIYEESKRKIGDANRSDDDQSLAKRIK